MNDVMFTWNSTFPLSSFKDVYVLWLSVKLSDFQLISLKQFIFPWASLTRKIHEGIRNNLIITYI